jgi:Rps23 Pro-64 3,4-dihydroxylase Tpa1-like proline 4-hydroxylase
MDKKEDKKEYALGVQLDISAIRDDPIFGKWTEAKSLTDLGQSFQKATPFPYVVIDEFFRPEVVEEISNAFERVQTAKDPGWMKYFNPIEIKFANNNLGTMAPIMVRALRALNAPTMIKYIQQISGIGELQADEYLHGGGLHSYPSGALLRMHVDYSIHPLSGKERRLNLIAFVNKDWKAGWNGELELWDDIQNPRSVAKVVPAFNRAVLFQTTDLSYHGLPNPIRCPKDVSRNSLAVYYVSKPREGVSARPKAQFFATGSDAENEKLKKLLEIRGTRRLTPEDIATVYPDWQADLELGTKTV